MLEPIERWNSWLNGYVWGAPMIALLMGTGLVLTVVTHAVQFRHLALALRQVLGNVAVRTGRAASARFKP